MLENIRIRIIACIFIHSCGIMPTDWLSKRSAQDQRTRQASTHAMTIVDMFAVLVLNMYSDLHAAARHQLVS